MPRTTGVTKTDTLGPSWLRSGLEQVYDGVKDESAAYVAILRYCTKNKDLSRGSAIHDKILSKGLVEKCSDALITMFAKCGALTKAQGLLDRYKSRTVPTWTAVIVGFIEKDEGQNALEYYEHMQQEGLSPDAVAFTCILKACGSIGAAEKGKQIHDTIAKQGFLEHNVVIGNALLDMYAKCGDLARARQLLDELSYRNIISWTTLIAGYAQWGEGAEALNCLEQMRLEGLSLNEATFICTLQACGSIRALDKGEEVHDEIAEQGLLGHITIGSALVDMYVKCGALTKAYQVLSKLPVRNVVTWNALIVGYVQDGEAEQAMECYERMQSEGLSPDGVTSSSVLKACGILGAFDKGVQINAKIIKRGMLGNNVVLGTALMEMYVKCGALAKARGLLKDLLGCDSIAWNALIAGYVEHNEAMQALECFDQMQRHGIPPNASTFSCILKACASLRALDKGQELHNEISKQGLVGDNIVLVNALVDMYAKCGAVSKAQQVLCDLPVRNVISWTSLMTGFAQQREADQALDCFEMMRHEGLSPDAITLSCLLKACASFGSVNKGIKICDEIAKRGLLGIDVVLGTSMVDMYAKCGALAEAQLLLEKLPFCSVSSWCALIGECAKQGNGEQALNCYEQMRCEGIPPDALTFIAILKACACIGAAKMGERIHDEVARWGLLGGDIMLGNTLVDMYAKCGAFVRARKVLEELPHRNVISWNALITGYTQWCEYEQAWNCFEQMQEEGLPPNAVTFTCILKACAGTGAPDKGESIHNEISKQGLLEIDALIGTALVDMYAKCGALMKARQVLEELCVHNVTAWNALIAGYAQWFKGAQALLCFERMQQEGVPPNATTFSCLHSACSCLGLVEDAQMHFASMSRKDGRRLDLEHYTSINSVLGCAGCLDKAIGMIEKMPFSDTRVWSALLGACGKWRDWKIGRWDFECAIQEDRVVCCPYG